MLTHWYFCCCINADPDTTQAFLSILEILDNPESDEELFLLALDELCRTEIWMQAYAFPHVLAAFRRQKDRQNEWLQRSANANQYVEALLQGIPKEIRKEFTALHEYISHPRLNPSRWEELAELCGSSDKSSYTSTPYLDLKEYLPQTLLLCVIANEFAIQSGEIRSSTDLFDKRRLSELFQEALEYRHGRLAFHWAALILLRSGKRSNQEILRYLQRIGPACIALEPDLLELVAEVLFLAPESKVGPEEAVDQLLREASSFEQHRLHLRSSLQKDWRGVPLEIIDLVNEENAESMSLAYWQAVLWEWAARCTPQHAAVRLADQWMIPPKPPTLIEYYCEDGEREVVDIQLGAMLSFWGPEIRGIRIVSGAFSVKDQQWLLQTPWVGFRSYNRSYNYPQAKDKYPQVLVRLVSSVCVAIRLLQMSAPSENRARFAELMAHAQDVFSTEYEYWLNHRKNPDKVAKNNRQFAELSPPFTALALFGRAQIRLAGAGKLTAIAPQMFLELLDAIDDPSANSISDGAEHFYSIALPKALMRWIEDAYPAAITGSLPNRWLENDARAVWKVYERLQTCKREIPDPDRILAALLTRFLCPTKQFDLSEFNWRNATKKDRRGRDKPLCWKIPHRRLLLTERNLSPTEWEKNDWDHPEPTARSTRLVLGLERLDSLGDPNASDYGHGLHSEVVEEWRHRHWKNALYGIRWSFELDRFVRLRLVELLRDSKVLQPAPQIESLSNDLELIATAILEYACLYDLDQMRHIVFPTSQGKLLPQNHSRCEVQKLWLTALYGHLECRRQGLGERRYGAGMQDPRATTLIDREKNRLIQDQLTYLAYLCTQDPSNIQAKSLAQILTHMRFETWRQRALNRLRVQPCEVEISGENKFLFPIGGHEHTEAVSVRQWALEAATFDPNRLLATLFFRDPDTEDVANLFALSSGEITEILNRRQVTVLGILVETTPEQGKHKYFFNAGYHKMFRLPWETTNDIPLRGLNGNPLQPGDYVALTIKQGDTSWKIAQAPRELPFHWQEGDIARWVLDETFQSQGRKLRCSVSDGQAIEWKQLNSRLWDADLSRGFAALDMKLEHEVFARYDKNGKWRPIDRDLTDLLLSIANTSIDSVVLTFIGDASEEAGEPAWRFSTQPGENYVLTEKQFDDETADQIDRARKKYDDGGTGLLITVRPVLEETTIRLKLVEGPRISASNFHPELRLPFDSRNLEWRNLFEPNEPEIAEREGDPLYVKIPEGKAPGFYSEGKRKVRVKWEGSTPSEERVEVNIQRWDFARGIIEGENIHTVQLTEICPPQDWTWRDLIDWWRELKVGDSIKLAKCLGGFQKHGDGTIKCLTLEGLPVQADIESLSMRPLKEDFLSKKQMSRNAKVRRSQSFKPYPVRLENHETTIATLSGMQECHGILTSYSQKKGLCRVIWGLAHNHKVEDKPNVTNFGELAECKIWPRPGDLLKAVLDEQTGEYQFEVQCREPVRVRALWEKVEYQASDYLCYLGVVTDNIGILREVAERKPGELVFLPSLSAQTESFSCGKGLQFESCMILNRPTNNLVKRQIGRAILPVDSDFDKYLVGRCDNNSPREHLSISRIDLRWTDSGNSFFDLDRRFELRRAPETQSKKMKRIQSDELQQWQTSLEEYLQKPSDLRATVEFGETLLVRLEDTVVNRIPSDTQDKSWTDLVPIGKDQEAFIEGAADYDPIARIRLFKEGEKILASFRQVPAYSLPAYYDLHRCSLDTPISLSKGEKLYYVGPEEGQTREPHVSVDPLLSLGKGLSASALDTQPSDGSSSDPEPLPESEGIFERGSESLERHHRFEWGYGKTLLVPESQLRFDREEFGKSKFILFHGDIITRVCFLSKQNDPSVLLLNIDLVDLQFRFSEARAIYEQAWNYHIIHLLRLNIDGDRIRIRSVEGYDSTQASVRRPRSFNRIRASLTDDSLERLKGRLFREGSRGKSDWERNHPVIYGRLDWKHCEKTGGRELRFEQVRLSFNTSEFGEPLKKDELIMLKAGKIRSLPDDFALELQPLEGIHAEDLDPDFLTPKGYPLKLTRREFSVRQDLLGKLSGTWNDEAFGNKGSLLLIRVESKRTGIQVHYWQHPVAKKRPVRSIEALFFEVKRPNHLLYAAVIEFTGDKLYLEYRPGVYFALEPEHLVDCPADLEQGEVLRLEITESQSKKGPCFKPTRAFYSDRRYIQSGELRPSVVFPLNNLFRKQKYKATSLLAERENVDFWKNKPYFTIGGLPNPVAIPRDYDLKKHHWTSPDPAKLIQLMEQPHPKIAWLGRDGANICIAPATNDLWVGKLVCHDLSVRYQSLNEHLQERVLRWRDLTFTDEPIVEVKTRINQRTWKYHDKFNRYWVGRGFAKPTKLGLQTGWLGPLFFAEMGEQLRLRYAKQELLRFGYPVSELIGMLRGNRPHIGTFTVACVADKMQGLWIEMAPGRLVEVSAQLFVYYPNFRTQPVSLANLNWGAFAPGDRVELRLVAKDALAIEQFELLEWVPGPRAALGHQKSGIRCFLPVSDNQSSGALKLGAGLFELQLPFEEEHKLDAKLAILDHENHLEFVWDESELPKKGDVFFLRSDQGALVPQGFPGYTARLDPSTAELWRSESTQSSRIDLGLGANHKRLVDLIEVLDGFLPVTTEYVDVAEKRIDFSLRRQREVSTIIAGRFGQARIIGLWPNPQTVLLRCGGGLFKMPMENLVIGLPEHFNAKVATLLRTENIPIWFYPDWNRVLRSGYKPAPEPGEDFQVENVKMILPSPDQTNEFGMLCRAIKTGGLYWLPSQYAAWMELTPGQMELLATHPTRKFSHEKSSSARTFTVTLTKKGSSISLIDGSEAKESFRDAGVGSTFTVNVRARVDNAVPTKYIVESAKAKVLLLCNCSQELDLGDDWLMEVTHRTGHRQIGPRTITVVPLGNRSFKLDLPSTLTSKLPAPEHLGSTGLAIDKSADIEGLTAKLRTIFAAYVQNPIISESDQGHVESWVNTYLSADSISAHGAPERKEVNVADALRAIIILGNLGLHSQDATIGELAYRMAIYLARSALRSPHCEAISRIWGYHRDNRERSDYLWARWKQFEELFRRQTDGPIDSSMKQEDITVLRQFCYSVELRARQRFSKLSDGQEDLRILAHAISAALGELTDIPSLSRLLEHPKTEVVRRLIALYRCLPPTVSNAAVRLEQAQLTQLEILLKFLLDNQLDNNLFLLDPMKF